MRRIEAKRSLCLVLVLCAACLLGACSRLSGIELPPLPTPSKMDAAIPADAFGTPAPVQPGFDPLPESQPTEAPIPTLPPTPEPTPVPTPTPMPTEDPNIPHLYIENASYPEDMPPYSVVNLFGDIYTDKGVIAMVWGRIVDLDGTVIQNCRYYPYTDTFSLAGTVNAELRFGVLEPGHYVYIVSAIAENKSFTNGEEILIQQPFEVYYP